VAARDLSAPESEVVAEPPGPTQAPFGSWVSAIRVEDLVGDVVRLAEPWIDGDDVRAAAVFVDPGPHVVRGRRQVGRRSVG